MRKSLLLASFICLVLGTKAQFQIGQSISNYSGTNSLYSNPSNVVDSRFKFYLNLTQTSLHFSNDYLTYNGGYHPFAAIPGLNTLWKAPAQYQNADGSLKFEDAWIQEELNGKPKNVFFQFEQRLFNFQINLGQKSAIAVGNRTRLIGQFTNLSEPLARIIRYEFDTNSPPFQSGQIRTDQPYYNFSFNINAFAYNETSLTYGHVLVDQKENFLKGGITGKFFIPLYGMYLRNEDIDLTVYGQDSFEFSNADIEYGYVSDLFFTEPDGQNPLRLGRGFGMDIGFTYEYRPDYKKYRYQMDGKERWDNSKNKYLLRVQASFNDFGSVTLKNDKYVRAYKLAPAASIFIDPALVDTMQVIQDRYASEYGMLIIADSLIGRTVGFESRSNEFTWKLPANFTVNVDYRIARNVYINALWIQSLRGKQVNGIRGFSLLSFTPRFESRWFEASMPL
ncbi:MAG: DUF5723 family protein, partial [Bacteroidota bacterium]|nr:DUF5723 family protein [Bacteroidota bacterium]MDX5430679.1 DUF5723 family protein [Bacteroidota bacterium]MDX5469426.1 DUF5723 family protein [Bacteroidota bacterium]